jgi:S-adenosylmethionine-diacylgycerolhomoserine-N-methlytransferase
MPPSLPKEAFGLDALARFYSLHARVYDWTRPFLLAGRREAVEALDPRPDELVLDVGCGTGFSLPLLSASGARVVGIEPSAAMRARAAARIARRRLNVELDDQPYGSHDRYEGRASRILFSYSLSMIPPFAEVLERARRDLAPGGRLVVVDFRSAVLPAAWALARSHVFLGDERLDTLRRLFARHELRIVSRGAWTSYLFAAERG